MRSCRALGHDLLLSPSDAKEEGVEKGLHSGREEEISPAEGRGNMG